MRKSMIILYIVVIAPVVYLYGCASSEEEDKYNLITKKDRKDIATICGCLDPMLPYLDKVINAKDSLEAAMYADSLDIMGEKIEPCFGNIKSIEKKLDGNDKYVNQFLEYVNENHSKCALFFVGKRFEHNEDDMKK